ncbi:hypothetical protein IWQ60_001461 [Tieghemiomyces parasiticus]|nr:hypothetical protein IWQ60_001461 [Tieghemiomyces parasiticus]
MLVWNINKMANGTQNYEATQIFRNLPTYKKEGLIKIGFYLLSFFFYLFGMVMGLINENVTAV